MGNFIKTEKSFTNGEVSINFFENDDIQGLRFMENFDVCAGGGLVRRPGLKKSTQLISDARLVSFSLSESQEYILAMMNGRIRIYANNTFVQDVLTPWPSSVIPKLQYTQRFGTMIFVHPDYAPMVLYYENGIFKIKNFTFSKSPDTGNLQIPFMRFEDSEDVTITITNSGGITHFIASEDFWTQNNVGGHLFAIGKSWLVNSYVSATDITVICNGTYTIPNNPISDWQEAAFSPRRGWPSSITFHQDRLVFGGAKSWPGGIWLSHVGGHRNFDPGTGLDDEAIFFTLLSDHRQHVCTLVSSDNLQILTSEGEWAVSNKPLTPESVDIKMHTSIGSPADRYLAPQQIEGKTIFVAKNKEIRQLCLDSLGENYDANNLCAFAEHLITNPVDISYNKNNKKLFVVMSDGNMAVLNYDTSHGISAWGRYTTDGKFTSTTTYDDKTFVVVKRGDDFFLEYFDDSEFVDAENYTYAATAYGLPLLTSGHNAKYIRITKITVRVYNTKTLFINDERVVLPNDVYSDDSAGFSGDASINVLGTSADLIDAPWKISTTDNLPLKILSVTIYGRYQI